MKVIPVIVMLWLACLCTAWGNTFADAFALEQQGKHAEAAKIYEHVLRNDGPSLAAFLNIGNCYYHSKDYGKAILAYERARRINPRDAAIRKNLALARKEAQPHESFADTSSPLQFLSRNEWAMLLLLSTMVIGISSISAWLLSRWRKSCIITAAIMLCPIIVAIIALQQSKNENTEAIITKSDAKLLLSPFASADEITNCPAGTLVQVQRQQGDFLYVKTLPNSTSGWLHASKLENIVP